MAWHETHIPIALAALLAVSLALGACTASGRKTTVDGREQALAEEALEGRGRIVPASCRGGDGPVVEIEADQGDAEFEQLVWQADTLFDARGARWTSYLMPPPEARNCYPIEIGADWEGCPPERVDLYSDGRLSPDPGPSMCLSGGMVVGKQPASASWHDVKDSGGAAVTVNALGAVIEGMRIHNVEDAFVPLKSTDFTIRGNWVSYNRDDCIENDAFASGTIEDNLFDGCYTFYSAVNKGVPEGPVAPGGGADAVVIIRDNLIWMENMPGPYKKPRDALGYAVGFKMWDERRTKLALHDNIFLIEEPIADGEFKLGEVASKVVSCADNTIIWLGEGDFPENLPEGCFRVIRDRSVWERARRDWLAAHPEVARLPDDAASR